MDLDIKINDAKIGKIFLDIYFFLKFHDFYHLDPRLFTAFVYNILIL